MPKRDTQRKAVYRWERFARPDIHGEAMSFDEVTALVTRTWRAERGRYGQPKVPPPSIADGRGTSNARGGYGRLNMPRWARNPWVIMHEVAHALGHSNMLSSRQNRCAWHGPRFVGILIGLACRHIGEDCDRLTALADEHGVKYDVRSIGIVPTYPWANRVVKLLPCTIMDAAIELNVSYRVIQGAVLQLIRQGQARYFRSKVIRISSE